MDILGHGISTQSSRWMYNTMPLYIEAMIRSNLNPEDPAIIRLKKRMFYEEQFRKFIKDSAALNDTEKDSLYEYMTLKDNEDDFRFIPYIWQTFDNKHDINEFGLRIPDYFEQPLITIADKKYFIYWEDQKQLMKDEQMRLRRNMNQTQHE